MFQTSTAGHARGLVVSYDLDPFNPNRLSVYTFSLYYPHKISCLVMRIKQMITHSILFEIKKKILPICLQGNYRDSLGEFGNRAWRSLGLKGLSY